MITATGNNFGAGTITFRAYSTEDILVLNGKVEVDVSSQAFLNASQLEIYLPNQPMHIAFGRFGRFLRRGGQGESFVWRCSQDRIV